MNTDLSTDVHFLLASYHEEEGIREAPQPVLPVGHLCDCGSKPEGAGVRPWPQQGRKQCGGWSSCAECRCGCGSVLPWGATPDLCPQPSEGAGPTAGLRVGRPSAAPCFCFIILEYFFTRSVIFQQVRRSVLAWRVRAARGRDAVRRSCRTHSFPVAPRGCALASCWVLEVFLTYM